MARLGVVTSLREMIRTRVERLGARGGTIHSSGVALATLNFYPVVDFFFTFFVLRDP